MTAIILQFPARPAAMPMPAIEAWLSHIDDAGPEPSPFEIGALLAECPDRDHEVAAWLRRRLPAEAS
ncbi:MAG: hypothetical protein ING19_07370 [Azospirillum sp.]|nr:hypothetical protein [Azospirillum sp.]